MGGVVEVLEEATHEEVAGLNPASHVAHDFT